MVPYEYMAVRTAVSKGESNAHSIIYDGALSCGDVEWQNFLNSFNHAPISGHRNRLMVAAIGGVYGVLASIHTTPFTEIYTTMRKPAETI